ncbi:TraB/GumN family protein [Massilia sp. Root335]|uniref:TraB/GumN family protein n=1 Tax=Massilia sp. Root335 TaxID=1736517 RepID=UPI0006F6A0F4|nr:TraB/GumN family protein [Massilia sp. Root335]KQV51807.1 hypothetical protein ASC93_07720 [Massilia sp. Root335]
MTFSIRRLIAGAAACMLAGAGAHAADTFLPRAWLVSNGKTQAVLVAESHFGTAVEQDGYYDAVVQPSYQAADVAVMETYMGPEEMRNETFERGAPCMSGPGDRRTGRLAPAFDALIAATRANGLEVPNWLDSWQLIPEFLFTSTYLTRFTIDALGPDYDKALETHLGAGTSFRLRALGGSAKKTVGLNVLKDQRNDFCSASAADRQDFLADNVLQAARLLRMKQADPTYAKVGELAAPMGRVFAAGVRCIDRAEACPIDMLPADTRLLRDKGMMFDYSPGIIDVSLRRRTRAWVPVIVRAMTEHRRTFIIAGALHLPDLSIAGKREPGLISQLRQRGYTVTTIRGPADIAGFLRPSWTDRLRALVGRP